MAALQAKAQQKAAEQPVKAATTTTTVTQRDADGNVVNVQRSQSSAEQPAHPKAPAPQEVADPFN